MAKRRKSYVRALLKSKLDAKFTSIYKYLEEMVFLDGGSIPIHTTNPKQRRKDMNSNAKNELENAVWNAAEPFFLSGQIDEDTFNRLINAVGDVVDAAQ